MEDFKKKIGTDMNDKEIVFSKSIKAGKRIYYLDVKKNRKDEMFLAITESKKVVMGEGDDSQVSLKSTKFSCIKRILVNSWPDSNKLSTSSIRIKNIQKIPNRRKKSNLKVNRRLQFWIAKSKLTLILNN